MSVLDEWFNEWQQHFPWWCVFAGTTALVFARLLRIAVQLGEDLAGTV